MHKITDYTYELRDSALGLWRFRDNMNDESSNDNDLVPTGVLSSDYLNGYSENGNTAVGLGNSKYGSIINTEATDFDFGTDDFSIAFIVRLPSVPSQEYSFLKKSNSWASPLLGWIVSTDSIGRVKLLIGDGTTPIVCNSAGDIHDGAWHNVAITIDRTNDLVRTYIDGQEDGNSPFSIAAISGNSITNSAETFFVGSVFLDIEVDEIMICDELFTEKVTDELYAGKLLEVSNYEAGFLIEKLPSIHHSNEALLEFLIPENEMYLGLKKSADDLLHLGRWQQCPEQLLIHMASTMGFELIDSLFSTKNERRNFLNWIMWIYRRRGIKSGIEKIIALLGFGSTITEVYNEEFPLVLMGFGNQRFYDQELIIASEFSEDFSAGLDQWDAPVSSGSYWRIVNGKLRGTGTATFSYDNAILFDDAKTDFYAEYDFEIIDDTSDVTMRWGMYLKYDDITNYVGILIVTGGGIQFLTLVANNNGSITSTDVNLTGIVDISTGTHKIWIHADLSNDVYTFGIGDQTFIFNDTTVISSLVSATKKGLMVHEDYTIDFDNIKIRELNPIEMPRLLDDAWANRKIQITLSGTPDHATEKTEYLEQVIPRYVPVGVDIEWL